MISRRGNGPRSSLVAIAALLPALSGCGLLWTHGPPENHLEMADVRCTTSSAGPTLDLLVGAAALGTFATVGIGSGSEDDWSGLTWPIAAGGVAFGVSGLVGLDKTRECRQAMERLRARLRDRD